MNIRKKLVSYGLIGFVVGPFINTIISLGISYAHATSWGWVFSSVAPGFVSVIGNQLNAYLVQFLLTAVLGAGISMAAVIWQMEHWSYAKRFILHFLALLLLFAPIGYFLQWLPHSLVGILLYLAIFIVIYFIYWAVITIIVRHKIKQVNQKLQQNQ